MKQLGLLSPVPDTAIPHAERMAPASLAQWERILPTLAERELEVLYQLCRYVQETGYPNATGGELAEFSGALVTSVRPRLTGLADKSLVDSGAMRPSRAKHESASHPYWPCVPLAAVARARQEQR